MVRQMRITRLGEGVDRTGSLSESAMARTLGVLADFRLEMDRLGVRHGRQVATSAVRDADNGARFRHDATEVTGLDTEVLSGEVEGLLSYRGATEKLQAVQGIDVVIDIGGGSTELAVGMPGTEGGEVLVVSSGLGCVRMSERYLRHDPPLPEEVVRTRQAIAEELDQVAARLPILEQHPPDSRLVGLAGSVSTLAALEQALVDYDGVRIHHFLLTAQAVDHWGDVLAKETAEDRMRRPGMSEGRQDVILGGVLVLSEFMSRFGFPTCLVSEADILDGLVASLL